MKDYVDIVLEQIEEKNFRDEYKATDDAERINEIADHERDTLNDEIGANHESAEKNMTSARSAKEFRLPELAGELHSGR